MLQNNLNFDQDWHKSQGCMRTSTKILLIATFNHWYFVVQTFEWIINAGLNANQDKLATYQNVFSVLRFNTIYPRNDLNHNLMPTIVLTMRKTQCKHIFVLQGNSRFNLYITVNAQHLNSFKREKSVQEIFDIWRF